ncbi:MAG: HEAT repeat domain-containing protein [Planctomycetota bacterium]
MPRSAADRSLASVLVLSVLALSRAPAARAGDFARQVLGQRDKDAKEQKAVRGRKGGITAEDALSLIRRERCDSTVSLVAGMYFEQGTHEIGKTAAVVRALAARRGFSAKAVVMAAWSPFVHQIVRDLLATDSTANHGLAAAIVATYAHALAQGNIGADAVAPEDARGRQPAGHGRVPIVRMDLEPLITRLLADPSQDVQELAVLAAAYERLEAVRERVVRLRLSGAPGLAGARVLYHGAVGDELPEELTRKVLAVRVRVPRRFTKLTPLLHSYDIRGHALIYGCQAVAAAADERFLDPMHKLLDHPDLRVQMEAARAIEAIGSSRSVPVLLRKLEGGETERPPWPVLVRVLSAIGAIPARESVPALFGLLKAGRGRFRQDAAYALLSIVPPMAEALQFKWDAWWEEHGEDFEVDPEATKRFRESKRLQDM